jgi:hypothetical protein
MYNIRLKSSNFIIKGDAQKHVVEYGFECKFHDLRYFKGGMFFIFLEFIIYFEVIITKPSAIL